VAGVADDAATRWQRALRAWAIPDHILEQAPADPWVLPVALFRPGTDDGAPTPSRTRAREALPDPGTVLDVGCGGGRASLALVPPAVRVVGVDRSEAMLGAFAEAADARGITHEECHGDWPAVAPLTPVADVVVCHHVAFNVPDLAAFAVALDGHAQRRVVVELTHRHPTAWLAPLWQRFWGVDRPTTPTAEDARDVVAEAGMDAQLEVWQDTSARGLLTLDPAHRVSFVRARLCLPPDRDREIARALDELPLGEPRQVATIWWDADDHEA
jgi:SAM-dependent methyltransferase